MPYPYCCSFRLNALALLLCLAGSGFAEEISFNRDVRPILTDRCFHCHGPDAENQDSEFRLDTRENAVADLGGYAGIVPKDLDKSELHKRIHSVGDDQMPPSDSVRKLTDRERKILDEWIKQGAPFEGHWAFQPLPGKVAVPDIQPAAQDWPRNEIDYFIHRGIASAGLQPNEELSKEKWLRRVTFDLTGLPPTLAELKAFRNDDKHDAYERVVDRLLDSDACAERLASEWLDVARYSDTYGYQVDRNRFVWPYRDWVIKAFRENLPYDEFMTWQIAGDMLPNATRDQQQATTFCRLHSYKVEGGSSAEEFRTESVSDRSQTFASAFLGLTMECARCHDHKYDPLKTKEYYQLTAFFANIDERGLMSYFTPAVPTPAMPLPNEKQDADLAAGEKAIAAAELDWAKALAEEKQPFLDWMKSHKSAAKLNSLVPEERDKIPGIVSSLSFDAYEKGKLADRVRADKPTNSSSKNELVEGHAGKAIRLTGDDGVKIPGVAHFRRDQPFSFSLWIKAADLPDRSLIFRRSRAYDDAGSMGYELLQEVDRINFKLVHFWPGNAIAVQTTEPLQPDRWYHIGVTYDGSSKAAGLRLYVNGDADKSEIIQDTLTRTASKWGGEPDLVLGQRFRDRGFKKGLVDEMRIFERELSAIEVAALAEQTMESDKQHLHEHYRLVVSQPLREAREKLREARVKWNDTMDSTPAIVVMRESKNNRKTHVLTRGAYDDPGEEVTAETPAFLPPFDDALPRNRLGLAKWATDPNHPLTSRVTVNRYWQLLFGEGLVRTPEDFGLQGEAPTHPQLLDWLARRFVSSGWDVRELLRMVVLSSTYRQSSIVPVEIRSRDPENRVYARGPNQRLSAEMVRDNALVLSGLLVDKVGGAPVKPYDLKLAYNAMDHDKGEGLYRRSLYTFWKRTSPAPVMMTMNANKREVCRLQREVASSPLQALVLLNGPQFIEAARVHAAKLLEKHGDQVDDLVAEAFELYTSRPPNQREAAILRDLYEQQREHFADKPEEAKKMLGAGAAPENDKLPKDKLAAATILVNSIMNLDESVRLK